MTAPLNDLVPAADAPPGAFRLRAERLVPVAMAAIVLLVAIQSITPWPVGAFEDDAMYTVLAKALATGQGYRLISIPGAPHGTHYPPGYPFFLSLLWRINPNFPDNIVFFKFANAAFLSLAAFGAYRFARSRLRLNELGAAALSLAGTLAIVVLLVTGVLMSEPCFMALLFPALLLAESSAERGGAVRPAAAGLLLGALALVRTLGAVAIPAAVLVMLVRRRVRSAIALAAASIVVLIPWQLWVSAYQHEVPPALVGKYGAYGPWVADGYRTGGLPFAWGVITANVLRLKQLLGFLTMPVATSWPHLVAFLGVIALLVGGVIALWRWAPVTSAFLAMYGAVVLLWPFEPDRFLLGIWPLLTIAAFAAIRGVWRWHPTPSPVRIVRIAVLAVAALLVGGNVVYNVQGYRGQWWIAVQKSAGESAKPIAEWVEHHTALHDVLSTEHDLIVYLYTGRRAIPVSTFLAIERVHPLAPQQELFWIRSLLSTYKPRFYITAWAPALRAADSLAAEQPPAMRIVGNTGNAPVYQYLNR